MSVCTQCGEHVGAGVRFCNGCGTPTGARPVPEPGSAVPEPATRPAPARPQEQWQPQTGHGRTIATDRGPRNVVLAVAAVLAVVVATAGGGYLYTRSAGGGPVPPPVPTTTSTAAPPTTTWSMEPVDSSAALQALADTDRSTVASLQGYWVPQLSSKRAGMVIDGTTWDDDMVLDHVRSMAGSYPDVLLLNSSDYSSFRTGGLWVLVEGQGFTTSDAANAWCDQQSIGADDCFAKRIAQDGPGGNTAPR